MWTPVDAARTVDTPKIPMEPAIATRIVRLDLDNKLEADKAVAVKKDIELFFFLPLLNCFLISSPFCGSFSCLISKDSSLAKAGKTSNMAWL